MGILGKVFGAKHDYPPLDSSNPAAKQLESVLPPLEELAEKTSDPLEIVPTEDSAYIFVGKPPKKLVVKAGGFRDIITNGKTIKHVPMKDQSGIERQRKVVKKSSPLVAGRKSRGKRGAVIYK